MVVACYLTVGLHSYGTDAAPVWWFDIGLLADVVAVTGAKRWCGDIVSATGQGNNFRRLTLMLSFLLRPLRAVRGTPATQGGRYGSIDSEAVHY